MHAGVNLMLHALDAATAPVHFFLRDDDAGWDDARLIHLLDCCARAGVPLDLAVIPQACSPALARELCARIDAAPGRIGVHQHGDSHANHEAAGRKCEFGAARSLARQHHDLTLGRTRLHDLFGPRLDTIFTPPWNRCSAATPALLAALGYTALSRDGTAPAQAALPELAVQVDWCKQQRLAAQQGVDAGERLAAELARQVRAGGGVVGVMLHHAEMNAHDLLWLEALIAALASHPHARWLSMNEILCARKLSVAADESARACVRI